MDPDHAGRFCSRFVLRRQHDYSGDFSAFGDGRAGNRRAFAQSLRRAGDCRDPHGPVFYPASRYRGRRSVFRADHDALVRRPGPARNHPCDRESRGARGAQPAIRVQFCRGASHAGISRPWVGCPRGHGRRGAVHGYGSFRPVPDSSGLVQFRAASSRSELLRSRRAFTAVGRIDPQPVLSAGTGVGVVAVGGSGDGGDRHRVPGRDFRGVFGCPAGSADGLATADANRPHLRRRGGTDLCAFYELDTLSCGDRAGDWIPEFVEPGRSLRYRRDGHHDDRHDSDRLRDGAAMALALGVDAAGGRSAAADRYRIFLCQCDQNPRGRVVSAGGRPDFVHRPHDVAAWQTHYSS